MFLLPHHFQQETRYLEHLVDSRVRSLTTHGWGFTSLELDEALLADADGPGVARSVEQRDVLERVTHKLERRAEERGLLWLGDEHLRVCPEHLGEALILPPAFEHLRSQVEPILTPLPDPRPWARAT